MAINLRGVTQRIIESLDSSPVVILEGARSVGKTTLTKILLNDGKFSDYIDLSYASTLEVVTNDGDQFVDVVELPVAIDEAQLAPNLLLPIKRRVDNLQQNGNFLLTGSSKLRRDELGGSDPLAGRSVSVRLLPFTQGEIEGQPIDLVSKLFDGNFEHFESYAGTTKSELAKRISRGCIPQLLESGEVWESRMREYINTSLSYGVGSRRFDRYKLLSFYQVIASNASLINLTRLSSELKISKSTLTEYLSNLRDSFLVESLRGYSNSVSTTAKTAQKIFAIDTSVATWAARLNRQSLQENNEALGHLTEQLVCQDLIAQSEWSTDSEYSAYYWRSNNKQEVDLVLVDSQDRAVAIEIKSSSEYSPRMASGVRSFRNAHKNFHHGYVFYAGDRVVVEPDGIKALPISTLWTKSGSERSVINVVKSISNPGGDMPGQPIQTAIFLSYVHADDAAVNGRISQLGHDIEERYKLLTGEDDVHVFVDKNDLRWGEEWQNRIDNQLEGTTIFIPVVTPRYLKSQACRDEVQKFLAVAKATGNTNSFCPLRYVDTRELDETDPVEAAISKHQHKNWSLGGNYANPDPALYESSLNTMVRDIIGIVEQLPADEAKQELKLFDANPVADDDMMTVLGALEEEVSGLEGKAQKVTDGITVLGEKFELYSPRLEQASDKGIKGLKKVLDEMGNLLNEDMVYLQENVVELKSSMKKIDDSIDFLIKERNNESLFTDEIDEIFVTLESLENEVDSIDESSLNQMLMVIRSLGRFSKSFREPSRIIEEAMTAVFDLVKMPVLWQKKVRIARGES